MISFKKKSKPDDAPHTIPLSLTRYFEDANHGHGFRTISFHHHTDDAKNYIFWRKASRNPETRLWAVYDIKEERDAASKSSVPAYTETSKKIKDNLTFFDAAYNLAQYETSQRALGYLAASISSIQDIQLAEKHVKAFAEREGLVFDSRGLPHPTINGEIVTEGTFPKGAHDKAQNVPPRPQPKIIDHEDLLRMLMSGSTAMPERANISSIFKAHELDATFKAAVEEIKDIIRLCEAAYGFNIEDIEKRHSNNKYRLYDSHAYQHAFGEFDNLLTPGYIEKNSSSCLYRTKSHYRYSGFDMYKKMGSNNIKDYIEKTIATQSKALKTIPHAKLFEHEDNPITVTIKLMEAFEVCHALFYAKAMTGMAQTQKQRNLAEQQSTHAHKKANDFTRKYNISDLTEPMVAGFLLTPKKKGFRKVMASTQKQITEHADSFNTSIMPKTIAAFTKPETTP